MYNFRLLRSSLSTVSNSLISVGLVSWGGWPGGGNGVYYTHHVCFVLKRTGGGGGSTSSCKTKYLPVCRARGYGFESYTTLVLFTTSFSIFFLNFFYIFTGVYEDLLLFFHSLSVDITKKHNVTCVTSTTCHSETSETSSTVPCSQYSPTGCRPIGDKISGCQRHQTC